MRTSIRHTAAALTIIMLALGACTLGGTSGAEGNFNFLDTTPGLDLDLNRQVDRALAVGARLKLEIKASGTKIDVLAAESDNEQALKVVSTGNGVVVVEGAGGGSATLKVTDSNGTTDSIVIYVEAIDQTTLQVLPWTSIFALPDRLFPNGFAMLPSSPVDLFVDHRDASGNPLTGFGAETWALDGDPDSSLELKDSSDFAVLRTTETLEDLSLTYGASKVEMPVIDEASPMTLQLYSHTQDADPVGADGVLEIEAGKTHVMLVGAYLEDGRYVVGPGSAPIVIKAEDDAIGVVTVGATPQSADEAGEEAEDDLARILANGRAFTLATENTGDATLTVEWLDQTVGFTVRVIPKAD